MKLDIEPLEPSHRGKVSNFPYYSTEDIAKKLNELIEKLKEVHNVSNQ